jgi:dihydrofolate reductase
MGKVTFNITMSLDGYSAGPNARAEEPLGDGGEQLHEWALRSAAWRETHGHEGGTEDRNSEIVRESTANVGAYLMGRKMFDGGEGPLDESWHGWWGENPPYGVPVFVLTHHEREALEMEGGTTFEFVNDGIEAALERARAAAGERDVVIAGGADVAQQYLRAGLVDEFQVSVAPVLLGGGVRLLDGLGNDEIALEADRVVHTPEATHLRYRVVR